jgi:hypothetical protein
MEGRKFGYVRFSTGDQTPALLRCLRGSDPESDGLLIV